MEVLQQHTTSQGHKIQLQKHVYFDTKKPFFDVVLYVKGDPSQTELVDGQIIGCRTFQNAKKLFKAFKDYAE